MSYAALPVLRTPRLTLRPLIEDDADAIVDGVGNFDVSKWLAVVPYPYGRKDAESFIARVSGKPYWGVHDQEHLVGVVSLDNELAYWIARDRWGRGYGFEAAHAAVGHWFGDKAAPALGSGHFDGNDASRTVLLALGFRQVERITRYARSFRQDVVSNQMQLTRADWDARTDFTLATPRLTLRPMTLDDAPALADMAVPEVARMMATLPAGLSVTEAREWIAPRLWTGYVGFMMSIIRQGKVVGALGFGGSPPDVAYFLAPEYWGHGLATEALAAFLPAVFRRFPVSRIAAGHFEDNPASAAVLAKLGFEATGRDIGQSKGRLEPAPLITYAVTRDTLRVP